AENMIDCLLAMQRYPQVVAVASTAGAATWRDEWTELIKSVRPRRSIVWYDNDLAGTPNKETHRRLIAERLQQGKPPIEPNGPQVANSLLGAGIATLLYEWPRGTPAKADLGWALAV